MRSLVLGGIDAKVSTAASCHFHATFMPRHATSLTRAVFAASCAKALVTGQVAKRAMSERQQREALRKKLERRSKLRKKSSAGSGGVGGVGGGGAGGGDGGADGDACLSEEELREQAERLQRLRDMYEDTHCGGFERIYPIRAPPQGCDPDEAAEMEERNELYCKPTVGSSNHVAHFQQNN